MDPLVPGFLYPFILYSTLVTLAALLFGLNRSLKLANWPDANRTRALWSGAALLAVFYTASVIPSRLNLYHGSGTRIPTIQYGLLAPILIGVLFFLRWPALRRVIAAVPQQWLVGIQLYRVEGFIFLVFYSMHRLPAQFALAAGIGDITVGLLASIVAIAYLHNGVRARGLILAWNLFGLLDLVVAVGTGMLTSPSPLHLFAMDEPNELISRYPLVMIPVFLVPLSILLHLASLQKLRHPVTSRAEDRLYISEHA